MTQTISVESRTGRSTPIIALLLLSGITLDIQYGILAPLIGVIATESGLTGSEIGWVLNALMMGSVISVSLTARMGDIFGHRKVLIALIVLALVGCALGATANGFWPLVAGRFLMGLAVTIPLSWGLLRPRATARQIRLVSLVLSTVMAVLVPLALIAGGLIVGLGLPWETVFWVTFALYGVMLILALKSPETPAAARAVVQLDWFGALGLGVWVTALLVGIAEGPGQGWTSPLVLGAFVVSAVTLAAWIIQQRRAQEPLVSFRNMDIRQTLIGYSGILLISLVGQGIFIVLPAWLQTPASSGYGHGLSALDSSLRTARYDSRGGTGIPLDPVGPSAPGTEDRPGHFRIRCRPRLPRTRPGPGPRMAVLVVGVPVRTHDPQLPDHRIHPRCSRWPPGQHGGDRWHAKHHPVRGGDDSRRNHLERAGSRPQTGSFRKQPLLASTSHRP